MQVPVLDGVQLCVQDVGAGPPVVLIHGWSLNHRAFARQIELLTAAGHRVLAVDLRGHGASSAPDGGYEIERLTDDVVAVLLDRGVFDAVIVGWSLGGMVALRLSAAAPSLVSRIVLIASNGVAHARQDGFPFGVSPQHLLRSLVAAELEDRRGSRRRVLQAGFKDQPHDDVLDHLLALSLETETPAAVACMSTLLLTDQTEILDRVRVPVRQILGSADHAVSLPGAAWLCEQVGAEQVVLSCGHYPMFEMPDEFDSALVAAVRT